jgi:hypothetical protein
MMGIGTVADDWQVVSGGQGGFGLLVAGSIFVFHFYSKTADFGARFQISGSGWGLGGNVTGANFDMDDWTSIECSATAPFGLGSPFSVNDLNGAPGHVATAGVGLGIGWGPLYISAGPKFPHTKPFFSVQNVGGWGLGVGVGAISVTGPWRYTHASHLRP